MLPAVCMKILMYIFFSSEVKPAVPKTGFFNKKRLPIPLINSCYIQRKIDPRASAALISHDFT